MQGNNMLWHSLIMLLCSFIQSIAVDDFNDFHNGHVNNLNNRGDDQADGHTYNGSQQSPSQYGMNCERNFNVQLHKCMDPFSRKVHLYTTTHLQNPLVNQIFVKHVCRRYKKMLMCIHTVLTNCQTGVTMQTVQHKLSKAWVLKVNNMCNIQLNPLQNRKGNNPKERKDNSDHKSHSFSTSIFLKTNSDVHHFSVGSGDVDMSVVGLDKSTPVVSQPTDPQITIPTDNGATSKLSTGIQEEFNRLQHARSNTPNLITIIQYRPSKNVKSQKPSSVIQKPSIQNSIDLNNLNSLLRGNGKNSVFLQLLLVSVNEDGDNQLRLLSDSATDAGIISRTASQLSSANAFHHKHWITCGILSVIAFRFFGV